MSHNTDKIKKLITSLTLLFFCSCTNTKNITYFKDVPDTLNKQNYSTELSLYQEPRIKPNDLLQVTIQTLDPQTNNSIGTTITSGQSQTISGPGFNNSIPGLLVNKEGYIELPLVGRIKVDNLTTSEATDTIRKKATYYYKEPVINVRFANFSITVLGEVSRPGTYIINNERVSVLDAIGMAGDLTIYGKRSNILIVREEYGKKSMTRIDLTHSNMFKSPYYYLRQSDLIYVEPNKAKVATNDMAAIRNLTVINAAMSLLVVILSRINF